MKKTTKKTASKRQKKVLPKTHVVYVVDRSGSMRSIHKQAVDAINEQIGELKTKKGHDIEVTVIEFDHMINTLVKGKFPNEIEAFTSKDFIPRGTTAMNDAIWQAIAELKEKPSKGDVGFLICVISDGGENASKEVTPQQLKDEIEKLQATNKYTFTYLLANQDAYVTAQGLGSSTGNAINYCSTDTGTLRASSVLRASTCDYLSRRLVGITATNNFYNGNETITDLTTDSSTTK